MTFTKRIAQHATCGLKYLTNPTTCCQVRWAWPVGWILGDGKRVGWERPFGVAKGLGGKWLFSCKLFGNSQRRSQFSQSASAQRFNNFAEQKPMYMSDWITKLDDFLVLNEKEILQHAGKVSRKDMEAKVRQELAKYREDQERKKLPSCQ